MRGIGNDHWRIHDEFAGSVPAEMLELAREDVALGLNDRLASDRLHEPFITSALGN